MSRLFACKGVVVLISMLLAACGGGADSSRQDEEFDDLAPVTVSSLALEEVSHEDAILTVGVDEAGMGYYLIKLAADPIPSIAAVQAGESFSTTAAESNSIRIQGLSPATGYVVYLVAADRTGNVQAELQSLAFQTLAAPDLQAPRVLASTSNLTESGGTFGAQINEAGKVFYLVQLASEAEPTQEDILAAASMNMQAEVWSYAEISGLSASTPYRIYFLSQDLAGNANTQFRSIGLQTKAPLYVEFGGLQWMPNFIGPWSNHEANWSTADSYCRNTEINGSTGWRLPTASELRGLATSGVTLRIPEWQGSGATWAADPNGSGSHLVVYLADGYQNTSLSTNPGWVSCVRALN